MILLIMMWGLKKMKKSYAEQNAYTRLVQCSAQSTDTVVHATDEAIWVVPKAIMQYAS